MISQRALNALAARTRRLKEIDVLIDEIEVKLCCAVDDMAQYDREASSEMLTLRQVSAVKLKGSHQLRAAVVARLCQALRVRASIENDLLDTLGATPLGSIAEADFYVIFQSIQLLEQRLHCLQQEHR